MKKLLLLAFILVSFAQKTLAQEKQQVNSVSIVAAPNWYIQLRGKQIGGPDLQPSIGYTVGFDFARKIAGNWQFKLGLRYNHWKFVSKSDFLIWPSEYATGQYVYDPSLPHYIERTLTDKTWQILAGARWLGKPKVFRSYADFEFGLTSLTVDNKQIYPTLGAGWGMEWKPGSHFGIFAEPGARFIFNTGEFGYKFLPLHLEMGGRYHF